MFTIFDLKNIDPFDEIEDAHIRKMLREVQTLEGFDWLSDLPLDQIKFFFAKKMNAEDGVCGAFSAMHPDNIYLIDFSQGVKLNPRPFWVEFAFPFAIHELRHCWQFRKHPLLYLLCCIPVIRSLTIELDAMKKQQEAEDFTDEFMRKEDEKQFCKLFAEKEKKE